MSSESRSRSSGSARKTARPAREADDRPAYQRIEAHLKALLSAGGGRTEPLPPEPDLAREFGVSRMTVRQAYQRLVSAGAVVRYRRLGSFAAGHYVEQLPIQGAPDIATWIIRGGESTGRRMLVRQVMKPPAEIAALFGLPAGQTVLQVRLLRFRDGVPCLDTRYMHRDLLPTLTREKLESSSLLRTMFEHGFSLAAGEISIAARLATADEASLLGIAIGQPVLQRRVVFRDRTGACVVCGDSRYPGGGAYTFQLNFHQTPAAAPPAPLSSPIADD